jgi:hypothetical protein
VRDALRRARPRRPRRDRAAAPLSIDKLKQAIEVFGPVMAQGYGQTEAPGAIAMQAPYFS